MVALFEIGAFSSLKEELFNVCTNTCRSVESFLYYKKGPLTALPVPIETKLVSFHTMAKCQTFFTSKISWLVESTDPD